MASLKTRERIISSQIPYRLGYRHITSSKAWLEKLTNKSPWYDESEQAYCDFLPLGRLKTPGKFDCRKFNWRSPIPQVRQYFIRNRRKFRNKESLHEKHILRSAWELTDKLTNREIAEESKHLLSVIKSTLYKYRLRRIALSPIPQLSSFLAHDGSVLFEWIFNDYRIGFSIETNLNDSSWYLITNKNLGEINASGFIHQTNLYSSVSLLLDFILSHSQKR